MVAMLRGQAGVCSSSKALVGKQDRLKSRYMHLFSSGMKGELSRRGIEVGWCANAILLGMEMSSLMTVVVIYLNEDIHGMGET